MGFLENLYGSLDSTRMSGGGVRMSGEARNSLAERWQTDDFYAAQERMVKREFEQMTKIKNEQIAKTMRLTVVSTLLKMVDDGSIDYLEDEDINDYIHKITISDSDEDILERFYSDDDKEPSLLWRIGIVEEVKKLPRLGAPVKIKFSSSRAELNNHGDFIFYRPADVERLCRRVKTHNSWKFQIINYHKISHDEDAIMDKNTLDECGEKIEYKQVN